MQNWMPEALLKVNKGENIHRVIRAELMELGLVVFVDSPKELCLTENGLKYLHKTQIELESGKVI